MTLRKSPEGLIRPYTREGVTPSLKKTAKDSAMIQEVSKLLNMTLKGEPTTVQEAEDVISDVELLALQMKAAAKSSIKNLEKTLKTIKNYEKEASK